MEARIGALEGVYKQVADRLNSIDARIGSSEASLRGEIAGQSRWLIDTMNGQFRWIIGTVLTCAAALAALAIGMTEAVLQHLH